MASARRTICGMLSGGLCATLMACGAKAHDPLTGAFPDAADGSAGAASDGANEAMAERATDAASDAEGATDVASETAMDGTDAAACSGPGARYVTRVLAHQFGSGQALGQDRFPENIFGPPHGAGCCEGSLDTVSLGNGGSVTLAFGENVIVDGPGPDFIVFENAFRIASGSVFAELATVEVSADGAHWISYPCTATSDPYGTCAGYHPVYANPDTNQINPLDPASAGGDPFDLSEIGVGSARFVRITDRPDIEGFAGVFDLDAVAIVNAQCR
jgi:hypothetical protein